MSPNVTLSWVLALAPEIGLLVVLFMVLIFDRLFKPADRRQVGLFTAWGALAVLLLTAALFWLFQQPNSAWSAAESVFWGGMMRNDLVTFVFRLMFLSALILTSLLSMDVPRLQRIEYYALLITATIGFSLMAASTDLIMIYVALETASISSYLLAGFYSGETRSAEAGMKYFVYGAFTTAVMLYGMSLLYGVTGQTNLYLLGSAFSGRQIAVVQPLLLLAAVLITVGFAFKTSIVPYHFWTPDVYEGAPTPFTGFLSTASKAAGFAVFLRVFLAGVVGPANTGSEWWAMLVAMCIITMTLGNFVAIFQTNIKRLLAYSSIAQAGYALIGLVTLSQDGSGATMFYLLMYVFTNIAAFGVVITVSNVTKSDDLKDLSGLNRRSPLLALVMLFAVLSLGGIPPTAGFFGKFFLFKAAVDTGMWWLALIGILNAFIGLYYYLAIIKYMYLYRSEEDDVAIPVSRAARVGLIASVLLIIYLGISANSAFELTRQAAAAFFSG
ncbi:NADH-quinone oxidoreductase subunit N [Candidatus Promineifilum breve]|uniref:NADH-quinone oxidoreductase subunit N n=1 Tax=Candidatus Promineifilum breve TaxID=1806508 RepID=A0A160T6F7_9CHLR|nr:NADH-quinone oxidoreductase subunit N [Candidatus Promineifilum breve]CUS04575.2 NADH-quinone oxidoreductase subunit N [Candidatus Promineifilum breve]